MAWPVLTLHAPAPLVQLLGAASDDGEHGRVQRHLRALEDAVAVAHPHREVRLAVHGVGEP